MQKATTKSINAALKKAGIDAEFCHNRGAGYSYFIGPDVEYAQTTSVYVCYIHSFSVEQWVQEAQAFKAESTERAKDLQQSCADSKLRISKTY